ncbi:MAG: YceI family protein [Flavobacteriaceae bacterium]|nr:YceI family protein [Flavobacteriaceae bacterium]
MSTIWKSDATHSEITFKVRHMMISNVKGEFKEFDAEIVSEGDNFTQAKVKAVIKTDSIFTNNKDRDNHLRSADFFNAETYPEITFEGTSFEKLDEDNYKLHGDLSINGVTKNIALDVDFGGVGQDPYGNTKAGFTMSGKINRTEFGLNWNQALEAGGLLVSEEVKINAEVQFVKQ